MPLVRVQIWFTVLLGIFTLYEKLEELAVLYKVTHQTYAARSVNHTYVAELRNASEMVEASSNRQIASVNTSELTSANELLQIAAMAGIRYETEANNIFTTTDTLKKVSADGRM